MSRRKKDKKHRKQPRQQRRRSAAAGQRLQSGLWEAAGHMKRKRWLEACAVLEPLHQAHPRDEEVLRALTEVYQHLGDFAGCEGVAIDLAALKPDDPEIILGLAGAHLLNIHPALALRTFGQFRKRWPE